MGADGKPLAGRVCIVTGANTGIGKVTAKALAARGAHMFVACRNEQKAAPVVEEIADFFRLRRLSSYPDAIWTKTRHDPIYAQEHWDELRQFTSILTFTFRVVR